MADFQIITIKYFKISLVPAGYLQLEVNLNATEKMQVLLLPTEV